MWKITFAKDRYRNILTDGEYVGTGWEGYFLLLVTVENDREQLYNMYNLHKVLCSYTLWKSTQTDRENGSQLSV